MRLSGTYHPILYLLERASDFIPGIQEVSSLWVDFDKKILYSSSSLLVQDDLKIKAQSLRNQKSQTMWQSHSSFFGDNFQGEKQLSLADESNLNVLWLFIKSPIDNLKDIVTITFPKTIFLKSLEMEFQGLSTQEKQILGNLMYSIFSAEYNRIHSERKILEQFERINQVREQKIKQLKEYLQTTEEHYSSAIRGIILDLKQTHEEKLGKKFEIDNEIILKLAKERLSISQIEEVIKEAIYLAYHLNLTTEYILVTSDYLQLKKAPIRHTSANIVHKDKAMDLLDRYEESAQKVRELGLTVNGKNVAFHLDPPITPPAITDAVKNNKNKISFLLKQYPNRWKLIRQAIRPISNLDDDLFQRQVI